MHEWEKLDEMQAQVTKKVDEGLMGMAESKEKEIKREEL